MSKKPIKKKPAAKKAGLSKATKVKRVPKKTAAKKAPARNLTRGNASLINEVSLVSYRPVCETEDIRLDDRCMSKKDAFDIAQAHRLNTGHKVDIESC